MLYCCKDIFDEKSEDKEQGTNTEKNKWEKTRFQSKDTNCL